MNDGTQERTLDPPDLSLSDAELRECERAARDGFDGMDARAMVWIGGQLADTPSDATDIVLAAIDGNGALGTRPLAIYDAIRTLRDRYIAECAEDYWGDLIEQEKYAQEP